MLIDNELTPGVEVTLPPLVIGPVKYSVGYAQQLVRPVQQLRIVENQTIRISPRISERLLVLEGGERLIITDRRGVNRPTDVDGVLRTASDGTLAWLSHRHLEEKQAIINSQSLKLLAEDAAATWVDSIRYTTEKAFPPSSETERGLRPPQLGALFAIGSHWSLSRVPATIVMPTGTGKTEAMLAALAAHQIPRLLVCVPSKALRAQAAAKFQSFGLLRELNALRQNVQNPVVGVLYRRPKTIDDLQMFRDCNVVIGVPSSLVGGTATAYVNEIGTIVDALFVDEAHHIAASTWSTLRDAFNGKRVLQFTATPFRNDNKLVDGKVVYSYPLRQAQEDGYFKPIKFEPIFELDDSRADRVIGEAAIAQLRQDLDNGFDHVLMARCRSVKRAEEVFRIYEDAGAEFAPLLIHSELNDADKRLDELRRRDSRIVVCVNMLGEGVDIPALKIAAIHDSHQSLAVLLQFVGRFTRSAGHELGDATVVANIAISNVAVSLEKLYSQDADWNSLLREMSSSAAREHAEFNAFLENTEPFELGNEDFSGISAHSLRPVFSTLFYSATEFHPKNFHEGLSDRFTVAKVWLNESANTLFFVTSFSEPLKWTRSKTIEQTQWDMFVLHFDPQRNLLYLSSTNKSSNFENLANAVGAQTQIFGEAMFRSLGQIGRLVFNNLGVTKHGRRNLSFAMYTGVDVKQALSESEKHGSRKSNIAGYGWEDGKQVTIGCSYKGRVWSKMAGSLPKFIEWAVGIGAKLVDESIDTKSILENVLIPDWASTYPDCEVLSLDWPYELLGVSEDGVAIVEGANRFEFFNVDLQHGAIDAKRRVLTFEVVGDVPERSLGEYEITLAAQDGFTVNQVGGGTLQVVIGNRESALVEYFNDYPPLIRFVDLSEIDGNIALRAENAGVVRLPEGHLEVWDWIGTDITKESIWKDGAERHDSIQWRVAKEYVNADVSVVFDDDGAGEAADLICIDEQESYIRLALVHCKFSGGAEQGKRVKDVVEVASQAVRSARRPGSIKKLLDHVRLRYKNRNAGGKRNLFLAGSITDLNRIQRASRMKEIRAEIVIVQPGVSRTNITDEQSIVLGAAASYIKQTLGLELSVVCSD